MPQQKFGILKNATKQGLEVATQASVRVFPPTPPISLFSLTLFFLESKASGCLI